MAHSPTQAPRRAGAGALGLCRPDARADGAGVHGRL